MEKFAEGGVLGVLFHVSIEGESVLDDEGFGFGLGCESGMLLIHGDSLQRVMKNKMPILPMFPKCATRCLCTHKVYGGGVRLVLTFL